MPNLTAELAVKFSANQTGSSFYGGPSFNPVINKVLQFTSGVAASQADIVWAANRTIAASGNDDIDLNGVLTDAFGTVVAGIKLVALLIAAAAANTNSLIVGAGTNPYLGFLQGTTPAIKGIGPGGVFFIASPNLAGLGTITPATGDILRVTNGGAGTTVNYDIAILARTA